jgi:hypothetical protein
MAGRDEVLIQKNNGILAISTAITSQMVIEIYTGIFFWITLLLDFKIRPAYTSVN